MSAMSYPPSSTGRETGARSSPASVTWRQNVSCAANCRRVPPLHRSPCSGPPIRRHPNSFFHPWQIMTASLCDPYFVFRLTVRCFAVFGLVRYAEYLSLHRFFRTNGLFHWPPVPRTTSLLHRLLSKTIDPLLRYPGILFLLVLAVVAHLALLCVVSNQVIVLCLGITFIANLLYAYRRSSDREGAENLYTILSTALLLAALCQQEQAAVSYTLLFIAAQTLFCYLVTGVFKIFAPDWRNGQAVYMVMNNDAFGRKRLAAFLGRNRYVSRIISLAVTVLLTAMPLCIFLPVPFCLGMLVIAGTFHLINGLVMGLNRFFIGFLGTYPSILYTCCVLHSGNPIF